MGVSPGSIGVGRGEEVLLEDRLEDQFQRLLNEPILDGGDGDLATLVRSLLRHERSSQPIGSPGARAELAHEAGDVLRQLLSVGRERHAVDARPCGLLQPVPRIADEILVDLADEVEEDHLSRSCGSAGDAREPNLDAATDCQRGHRVMRMVRENQITTKPVASLER